MTINTEAGKNTGFEACCSMMAKCCEPGAAEKGFNFSGCEQMMKKFVAGKDGKVDFGDICSKMATMCKTQKKESNDRTNP